MVVRVLVTTDEKERQEICADILTNWAKVCVYIPISYSRTKAILVPALKGVGFSVSQYEIPFEKMYFE